MHLLKSISLCHKLFVHFHQIGTQVKAECSLNTLDLLAKTLDLVLHLQQVLVVEVLLLVNKLIA